MSSALEAQAGLSDSIDTLRPDSLSLAFLLHRNAWFVVYDESWYRLNDMASIEHAVAVLPLAVEESASANEQPHFAGSAVVEAFPERRLHVDRRSKAMRRLARQRASDTTKGAKTVGAEEAVLVRLLEADGALARDCRIALDAQSLARVTWLTKPYADKWVDAETRLSVEGVVAFEIDAYLPILDGSSSKSLRIIDETAEAEQTIALTRGESTTVVVLADGNHRRRYFRLVCDSEPEGVSSDHRQLGFVLVGQRRTIA